MSQRATLKEKVSTPAEAKARVQVLICFLIQNCAMGLAMGTFGPLLDVNAARLDVSRATAAIGMSAQTLAIGLLSPILGTLLQRISIRTVLIGGALVSALGYAGLAYSSAFYMALAMYALIGTGVAVLAILGPLTVVNQWYSTNRGKVLGIVNLPILLTVMPYVTAKLLPVCGGTVLLAGISAVFILIIPLLRFIGRPMQASERHSGGARIAPADGVPVGRPILTAAEILTSPAFWILTLGIGVITGAGFIYFVHVVAFGIEQNMTPVSASLLVSFYAAAGIAGAPILGWFADRIGAAFTLLVSAFIQALLWWALVNIDGPSLYAVAALLGICTVPLLTLHGAALSELFGKENAARMMGFGYLIKLPFMFTAPPLAGFIAERAGYTSSFLFVSCSLIVAALLFVALINVARASAFSIK